MITWYSLDLDSLVGRDLEIQTSTHLIRGPIEKVLVSHWYLKISFIWSAVKASGRENWTAATYEHVFWGIPPSANPVIESDGRIRFRLRHDVFGESAILPEEDRLDPFEVAGLKDYLEITSEVEK